MSLVLFSKSNKTNQNMVKTKIVWKNAYMLVSEAKG